jgi:hypothetical protein
MGRVADYRTELSHLDRRRWPAFMDEHSGLPGPRGNIELALAVADVGDDELFDELIASGDEYRTFCGVVGLGARAAEPQVSDRLRAIASDERWRVREAVAMALQPARHLRVPLRWLRRPLYAASTRKSTTRSVIVPSPATPQYAG